MKHIGISLICLLFWISSVSGQATPRKYSNLNEGWKSTADTLASRYSGFQEENFNDSSWENVTVPHNWDQYAGYRRLLHGNRHGTAWYRKTFHVSGKESSKKYFLVFEGVGSYAHVWLNGKKVGYHAGGRTTFTLDVTGAISKGKNTLAVRADHPAEIRDLPWVDGGDSPERGFSEGSQPMGIFRPVHLVVTNNIRIQPFGVHIWNDDQVSEASATLNIETDLQNYSNQQKNINVIQHLIDRSGKTVARDTLQYKVLAGQERIVRQELKNIRNVKLWSIEDPYLYVLETRIEQNGVLLDQLRTNYGIRWISWPVGENPKDPKRFLLNGKPVFINGIAEYEHMIGGSHAFTDEHVRSRVMQMKAAGFNSFRDAHQPHNLKYQESWDKLGILSWTQMAAHIWFDNPAFRENFKNLLIDWVKERRNSPSVVLWGLENESTLPADFAIECSNIIRKLDPTASSQRKITTCNGGEGTDWDVPQNWTGTYGGNPALYGEDLKRQVLVGEYGAWRTIDLHTEGPFVQNGPYSEERFCQLMEMKVRLADSVKNEVAGHYFWLYNSHDNPGRVQGGEGLREIDRIGPVNYKGLLTPWEEPLDIYYMYRANFAPKETEPMAYIVSHTWPNRWTAPGIKDSLVVYSNCDSVELFNDLGSESLGVRTRGGVGTHFQWDDVNIKYNVLYAVGYVKGKAVAHDTIVLQNLPQSPNFGQLYVDVSNMTAAQQGYNYLYRLNCGGPEYTDINGNLWSADMHRDAADLWGSTSWTDQFDIQPNFFASQRRTFDPIKGTKDWSLFQDFRYGLNELKFHFPVPDGEYLVELYFVEPWLGTGGGVDATGWRLFDVAINNQIVLNDLDLWKEAGHDGAIKKVVKAQVKGGKLLVSFPEAKAGQALISAIAIASTKENVNIAAQPDALLQDVRINGANASSQVKTWMDIGQKQFSNSAITWTDLPSNLFGATWLQTGGEQIQQLSFKLGADADVFVGLADTSNRSLELQSFEDVKLKARNSEGKQYYILRKRFSKGEAITLGALPMSGYLLATTEVSTLQPAFDLKASTNYKAFKTEIQTGVKKEMLMNQERLLFVKDSSQMNFEIKTGVADVYSLTLKYHNPFQTAKKATLAVYALDGSVLKAAEEVILEPSKEGKWSYLTTNTGTMINAGTYLVVLKAEDAVGVYVDAIDVQ